MASTALGVALCISVLRTVARFPTATARRCIVGLTTIVVAVGAFQVLTETGGAVGFAKWAHVTASSHISGAYTTASEGFRDIGGLLSGYEDLIAPMPPCHVSANPAGLPATHRVLLSFFEHFPALAKWVNLATPRAVARGLEPLERQRGEPLPPANRATIFVAAFVSRVLAILVVLPAAWLAGMRSGQAAAWVAAAAVGLVPAAILFAPRCDSVYPTLAVLITAVAYYAMRRGSVPAAGAAGFLLWVGMWMSLAFAAVGAMTAMFLVLDWQASRVGEPAPGNAGARASPALKLVGAAAVGWLIGPLVLYVGWRHNVFAIWDINLAKNDEFNLSNGRSYHTWIWVNLIELAVAMGLPAAVFLVARLFGEVRSLLRRGSLDVQDGGRCPPYACSVDALAASWCLVIASLNFSGLNRGEVARLWLPLMPFGVMLAAERVAADAARHRWVVPLFVALQAAACIVLARYVRVMT